MRRPSSTAPRGAASQIAILRHSGRCNILAFMFPTHQIREADFIFAHLAHDVGKDHIRFTLARRRHLLLKRLALREQFFIYSLMSIQDSGCGAQGQRPMRGDG